MQGDNYITNYQFRDNSIIVYDEWQGSRTKSYRWHPSGENLKFDRKKAYSGELSKGARKRLQKAITLMTQVTPSRNIYNSVTARHMPFKLGFVTLTVSDSSKNYTSKEVYNTCLRPFLQWMTKSKKNKLYVWKAELQKRGQIHYHIVISSFIPYYEIRNKWNYLQRKAGYLDGFAEKQGHYNPNSTDVHSMRNIKDSNAYLAKYMAKDVQKSKPQKEDKETPTIVMDGKVWDCSQILKEEKYFTIEKNYSVENYILEKVQRNEAYFLHIDYATIIFFTSGKPTHTLPLPVMQEYNAWRQSLWDRAISTELKSLAA